MIAQEQGMIRLCPSCGRDLLDAPAAQRDCDPFCKNVARAEWKLDNDLKRAVGGRIKARQIMAGVVAAESGVGSETVRTWLRRKGHLLKAPQLAAIGAWLGITPEEAGRLQGGTAEEKLIENGRRLFASPGTQAYIDRLRTDPRLRRTTVERAAAGKRGKTVPEDSRARISAGLKNYRQRDDAHPLGLHKKTLRGRAQTMITSLQQRHPHTPREEITRIAVGRLLQPPYNVRDEETARALLTPKPRRTSVRRRASRRPYRCALLVTLDAELPRLATGRRPHRFMREFEERLRTEEGDATPDYTVLKDWIADHERRCPKHRAHHNNSRAKP